MTGPMDRTGYYEGEVKGRTGLVPANYLLPLQGYRRPGPGAGHRSAASQLEDQNSEYILDMFNQLQQGAPAHRSQGNTLPRLLLFQ